MVKMFVVRRGAALGVPVKWIPLLAATALSLVASQSAFAGGLPISTYFCAEGYYQSVVPSFDTQGACIKYVLQGGSLQLLAASADVNGGEANAYFTVEPDGAVSTATVTNAIPLHPYLGLPYCARLVLEGESTVTVDALSGETVSVALPDGFRFVALGQPPPQLYRPIFGMGSVNTNFTESLIVDVVGGSAC